MSITEHRHAFFGNQRIPLEGSPEDLSHMPRKAVRRSRKTLLPPRAVDYFRAVVSVDDLAKIHLSNHLPLFVLAHRVLDDSMGRFQPGYWVRSSRSTK